MVVTNKQHAGVCERTRKLGIETIFAPAADFRNGRVLQLLQENHVDYIILAGFLLMVSEDILDHFPNKIINIHPALLPKHGGKGMYGRRVHEDVIANGDDVSGITIHYINKEYDKGETIFQAKCPVLPGDTSDTLAARVHELEYTFFPKVIEDVILSTN
jgi:phosphoribosylglycinamide formyltransferase-1